MQQTRFWLICAALLSGANPLFAAESAASADVIPNPMLLSDDLTFTLCIYYPRSTTVAALKPSGAGSGLAIDFEDTLDLEKRSFGLGVRSLTIDLDLDSPDWCGQARLSFQGPTAFMTVSF